MNGHGHQGSQRQAATPSNPATVAPTITTIELGDHSPGSAAATIRQVGEVLGYVVTATGPASFQLSKRVRKGIRRVEETTQVRLSSDGDGLRIGFEGPLDERLIEQLQASNREPSTPTRPVAPPDANVSKSHTSLPQPSVRPGAPPQGLISSVPGVPSAPDIGVADDAVARDGAADDGAAGDGAADDDAATASGSDADIPRASTSAGVAAGRTVGSPDVEPLDVGADHRVDASRDTVGALAPPVPGGNGFLVVVLPDGGAVTTADGVVFGRNPDLAMQRRCSTKVALLQPDVSKTHVAAWLEDGNIVIQDLHSTNGTAWSDGHVRRDCVPGEPTTVESPRLTLLIGSSQIELERRT